MDWSALLGALIGASAGILGSFVSSWAQSRKDRLAFNRDKVIAASIQYLQDCDTLFEAKERCVVDEAEEYQNRNLYQVDPALWSSVNSARDTVETGLTRLSLLCPGAFQEAQEVSHAAVQFGVKDVCMAEGTDDNGCEQEYLGVTSKVNERYRVAKSDFISQVRELSNL